MEAQEARSKCKCWIGKKIAFSTKIYMTNFLPTCITIVNTVVKCDKYFYSSVFNPLISANGL